MFTAPENFNVLPYNIPDAETSNTLPDFIDREEEERLIKVLGRPLYIALITGLAVMPTPDVKWTNIALGCDYTLNGRKYHWDGLEFVMTRYIYSRWLSENVTTWTNNGAAESETENSTKATPAPMIVKAFNEFSDRIGGDRCKWPDDDTLFGMLYANRDNYNDVAVDAGYPTFISYLYDKFQAPGRMNVFNL